MKKRSLFEPVLITLLVLYVAVDQIKEREVSATTTPSTGVWSLKDANISSFYEKDGEVIPTGISHDRAVLVNPEIVGDRVYWTDEYHQGLRSRYFQGKGWFYKDHLYQPETVYRVLDGEKAVLQTKAMEYTYETAGTSINTSIAYDPYLVDPPTIDTGKMPKVFLDHWHVRPEKRTDSHSPDPTKDYFFLRNQVELITP